MVPGRYVNGADTIALQGAQRNTVMNQDPRILLVDDEASIRLTLGALLERTGYDVTSAESGEQAVQLLERQPFDLLLTDLKMPGIDGMQVVAAARQRQPDVAVIVLTGHGSLESAIAGLHQQIFDYVLKTSTPDKVIERVKAGGPDWLPASTPRWLGGRISFGASLLQTAMRTEPTRLVVQLDDANERYLLVVNLCVANARYFGGGMKIAPEAKLTDGKFDVIGVGDLGALKIFTSAPRIYFGSHLSLPEVSHGLARKVVVRPAERNAQIDLEVDGELPGRLPATFQIIPAALRVRCR